MTIPEASKLVMQAGAMAKKGDLFVLDMGKPIKIIDLAENMIRLSGFVPYKDIDIVEIGLRPGEKLYEELLMNEEGLKTTNHNKIFVGQPVEITMEELDEILNKLRSVISKTPEEIKKAISEVVPTYTYTSNEETAKV